MANVIKLVQGDTKPSLLVTLTDGENGPPLNLTGTTPVLKFREVGAEVLTGEVPGSVVDPANGGCVFHWFSVPTILDGPEGAYEGEVEIGYPDGTKQTVYGILRFYLRKQF